MNYQAKLLNQVLSGLEIVKSNCDNARSVDGQGFNKYDGIAFDNIKYGVETWTNENKITALKLFKKYSGQHQMDTKFLELIEIEKSNVVTITGSEVVIKFAYKKELVEAVKTLGQVRWNPFEKTWNKIGRASCRERV
jgi:hypothetical protein